MSFLYHQPRDERGRFQPKQLKMSAILTLIPVAVFLLGLIVLVVRG